MASKYQDDSIPGSQLQAQVEGAKRFYSTGAYSDLTIFCKGQEWKVHKFQVCAQSEYFDKQCSSEFREAQEGKITLKEDDPRVVEAMLRFMYHGTYAEVDTATIGLAPILLDVQLFIIADKYFVNTLKSFARKRFEQRCTTAWMTPEFAAAVEQIYIVGLKDSSMKQLAVAAATEHLREYLQDVAKYADIHAVMREVPAFSADILIRQGGALAAEAKTDGAQFRCPICSLHFTIIDENPSSTFGCPKWCFRDHDRFWWSQYRVLKNAQRW